MKTIKHLFIVLLLLCTTTVSAHDFEVDGIYYNITSEEEKTVEVTYRGDNHDSYSFEYYDNVTIPSIVTYNGTTYSVTSIGSYTFTGCLNIRSIVEIPNSVTSIEDCAFYNCDGLTSIEIPNSVTSIGEKAFYDCSELRSIIIPNSVTSIGDRAFEGAFWYRNQPDGVVYVGKVLYKYKGTMPSNTSITIKEGTLSIASNVFYGCTGLTSVEIPNSVTSIGEKAFYNCSSIESIEIPNSVTSIGIRAFYNCTGVTKVSIGNSVTSIGSQAFYNCSSLTVVQIDDLSAWCNINFVDYSANPLHYGQNLYLNGNLITKLVVPDGVTEVKDYTFEYCSSIEIIEIPNSVTSIGIRAFYNCTGVTKVSIGNSVTSIGNRAFEDCSWLKTVVNFSNLTFSKGSSSNGYVTYHANAVYNAPNGSIEGDYIFGKPKEVNTLVGYLGGETKLILPTDYKGETYVIGEKAFYGDKIITSAKIANNVTSIGERAFSGCTSLKELCIEDGNRGLSLDGKLIFYDCPLETVYLGRTLSYNTGSDYNYSPFYDKSTLVSAIIGDNVAYIKEYLFKDCENLESAIIGANVENISKYAFSGCASLVNIAIPDSVTSIGESAFSDCTGLECVSIGKSVKNIYKNAFKNCHNLSGVFITDLTSWCNIAGFEYVETNPLAYAKNLYLNDKIVKELILPSDIIEIKDYTFKGCSSFTSVTVPNNIRYIRSGAFADCDSLKEVHIDDLSVWCNIDFENNPSNPLYYANNLYLNGELVTELVIPDNITKIKYAAFYNCTSLKSVEIPNSVTNIDASAFKGCIGLRNFEIPNSVTNIGNSAFSDCSNLASIKIPGFVTSIGSYAFNGCSSLTRVEIGESVTNIGNGAFNGCTSLKDLRIEDGTPILNLGYNSYDSYGISKGLFGDCPLETLYLGRNLSYNVNYAYSPFYNNKTLTSVTIGDNVLTISDYTFCGCTGITSVEIPNCVNSIGDNAFKNCNSLNEVHIKDLTAWCCIDFGNYSANPLSYRDNLYLNGKKITNLVIPEGVTEIKNLAFYGCSGLTSVQFSNSVESIGDETFSDCSGLNDITIPDGIRTIGTSAFKGCSNAETLYISNTIESIGENAFAECNNLYEIKIGSKKAITANENIFSSDAYNNACLFVPIGRKDFYAKTSPWNNFIIQEMDFTGIDEVVDELKGEEEKVKVKGLCYDLNGRVVENPKNGIYIISGKKVFVK